MNIRENKDIYEKGKKGLESSDFTESGVRRQETDEFSDCMKDDFDTFISKGADALIRDHPDLVKILI